MKFTFFKISLLLLLIHPQMTNAQTIRIGSWNIEWLSSTGVDKFEASNREQQDYDRLRHYADTLNANVIALQEVNDKDAARRVFGDEYTILLSARANKGNSHLQFNEINQYTGFAVHNSVTLIENPKDLTLGSNNSQKLRFGSYIVADVQGETIHLLSVHLKAGCQKAYTNSRSCKVLKQQADELNQWIKERVSQQQAFIIAGDFNHNLAYPNDWLSERLLSGTAEQVLLDSQYSKATCAVRSHRDSNKTHRYQYLIDHMLSYKIERRSIAKQQNYASKDVIQYQLSDHCPILTDYVKDQ